MDIQSLNVTETAKKALTELLDNVKPGTEGIQGMTTSNRFKIPVVKIVQPTSLTKSDCPQTARPGQLYIPNVNLGNSIDIVPVFAYNSRTMFTPGNNDGMIECSSLDMKTGSKYGKCADCPNLPWRNDMRTDCIDNVVVYALSSDLKSLVKIIFSKTSEASGKFLLRQASTKRAIWDTVFTVSTENKSKNGKTWLQWKTAVSATLPSEDVKDVARVISGMCKEDWELLATKKEQQIQLQPNAALVQISEEDDGNGDLPF
jgi:hypothetical protein